MSIVLSFLQCCFLAQAAIQSVRACAVHLSDLGTWCSGVEEKQLFCQPFPYTDVSQQELLELTLQLLWDFCPDGKMCRNSVQDKWGWVKRSREQCPLQRLQSEKLHHPFFFWRGKLHTHDQTNPRSQPADFSDIHMKFKLIVLFFRNPHNFTLLCCTCDLIPCCACFCLLRSSSEARSGISEERKKTPIDGVCVQSTLLFPNMIPGFWITLFFILQLASHTHRVIFIPVNCSTLINKVEIVLLFFKFK